MNMPHTPMALDITDVRFQDCVDADPALCEVFSLLDNDEVRDTFGNDDFGQRVGFCCILNADNERESIILDRGWSTLRLHKTNYDLVRHWLDRNHGKIPLGTSPLKLTN